MRVIGRKGGSRLRKLSGRGEQNGSLRDYLRQQVNPERVWEAIEAGLRSGKDSDRLAAARTLLGALYEEPNRGQALPWWSSKCKACGALSESKQGREIGTIDLGAVVSFAISRGLVTFEDGEPLVAGEPVESSTDPPTSKKTDAITVEGSPRPPARSSENGA